MLEGATETLSFIIEAHDQASVVFRAVTGEAEKLGATVGKSLRGLTADTQALTGATREYQTAARQAMTTAGDAGVAAQVRNNAAALQAQRGALVGNAEAMRGLPAAQRNITREAADMASTMGRNTNIVRDHAQAFERFGNSVQAGGRSMRQFGYATHQFTLPILAVAGAASYMAVSFDDSMNKILRLTDVSRKQMVGWRQDVERMAIETGKGPKELADALYYIASSGIKASDAIKVLHASARASAAGLGQTLTVADAVTSAVNAYGISNLSAAHATDLLLATVREGKAEPTGLAQSIGRVIPIASQMGVKFEDVAAAIASMTRTGLDSAESVTALRQLLAELEHPSKKAADAFVLMHTSAAALRHEIQDRGLLPTLFDMSARIKANGVDTGDAIPNIRALTGFLSLTGKNAAGNVQVFHQLNTTTGDVNRAFKEFHDSNKGKLDILLSQLKVTAIELGNDVLPELIPVLQGIAHATDDVVKGFAELPKWQHDAILGFLGVLAVAGPLTKMMGNLAILGGKLGSLGGRTVAAITGREVAQAAGPGTMYGIRGPEAPGSALNPIMVAMEGGGGFRGPGAAARDVERIVKGEGVAAAEGGAAGVFGKSLISDAEAAALKVGPRFFLKEALTKIALPIGIAITIDDLSGGRIHQFLAGKPHVPAGTAAPPSDQQVRSFAGPGAPSVRDKPVTDDERSRYLVHNLHGGGWHYQAPTAGMSASGAQTPPIIDENEPKRIRDARDRLKELRDEIAKYKQQASDPFLSRTDRSVARVIVGDLEDERKKLRDVVGEYQDDVTKIADAISSLQHSHHKSMGQIQDDLDRVRAKIRNTLPPASMAAKEDVVQAFSAAATAVHNSTGATMHDVTAAGAKIRSYLTGEMKTFGFNDSQIKDYLQGRDPLTGKSDASVNSGIAGGQEGGFFIGGEGRVGPDNVPMLIGGKRPIMVAEGEAAIANRHHQKVINAALARTFGMRGGLRELFAGASVKHMDSFATGGFAGLHAGVIRAARMVMNQFPGLGITSGLRTSMPLGHPDLHNFGEAIDLAGGGSSYMDRAAAWAGQNIGSSLQEGIHNPDLSILGGRNVPDSTWGPQVWADHVDHIHLGVLGGVIGKLAAAAGIGGGAGAPLLKAPRIGGRGALNALARSGVQSETAAINAVVQALAGGGMGSGSMAGGNVAAKRYARRMLGHHGWGPEQWPPLNSLWQGESGWNANAVNPSSGAAGIPQALGHGNVFALGDYKAQVDWGETYIDKMYGSPAAAYAKWLSRNPHWYQRGGMVNAGAFGQGGVVNAMGPTTAVFGDNGPETAIFIPQAQLSAMIASATGGVNHAYDVAPSAQPKSKAKPTEGYNPLTGHIEMHTPADWRHIHAVNAQRHAHAGPTRSAPYEGFNPITGRIETHTGTEWRHIHARHALSAAQAAQERRALAQARKPHDRDIELLTGMGHNEFELGIANIAGSGNLTLNAGALQDLSSSNFHSVRAAVQSTLSTRGGEYDLAVLKRLRGQLAKHPANKRLQSLFAAAVAGSSTAVSDDLTKTQQIGDRHLTDAGIKDKLKGFDEKTGKYWTDQFQVIGKNLDSLKDQKGHLQQLLGSAMKTHNQKLINKIKDQLAGVDEAIDQGLLDQHAAFLQTYQAVQQQFEGKATYADTALQLLQQQQKNSGTDFASLQAAKDKQGGTLTAAQQSQVAGTLSQIVSAIQAEESPLTQERQSLIDEINTGQLSGPEADAAQQQILDLTLRIAQLDGTIKDQTAAAKDLTTATQDNTAGLEKLNGTVTYSYQGQDYVVGSTSDQAPNLQVGI